MIQIFTSPPSAYFDDIRAQQLRLVFLVFAPCAKTVLMNQRLMKFCFYSAFRELRAVCIFTVELFL